eukprot:scaffold568959_cov23-Prasinocladus_malaysianus.AAC.1
MHDDDEEYSSTVQCAQCMQTKLSASDALSGSWRDNLKLHGSRRRAVVTSPTMSKFPREEN